MSATTETLTIPDQPADVDTLTAALTYADAGWYVLPVLAVRGPKHPGSVVGTDWPAKSSRDSKQITAWFAGTDRGIALHCGRSGAVVFDVDCPAKVPEVLRPHLGAAPYQSSRPDVPGRGHYVFAQPPGRMIGNGKGGLGGAWGEVRGCNGVIIAAPSPRDDGGEYRWVRTGAIPVLCDEIAGLLGDSSSSEGAASDTAVAAFIAEHQQAERPGVLNGLRKPLLDKIESRESVHMSTVSRVAGAMKEARAGYYPAQHAIDTLKPIFMNAVALGGSSDNVRTGATAENEWNGILAWAVGQALVADLDEVRARVEQKMPTGVVEVGRIAAELDDSEFWEARDSLSRIRRFARNRRACPWSTLGAALVRAVGIIPPAVTLPPLVGGRMSLNLNAALVGPPGGGKGASEAAARDGIEFHWCTGGQLDLPELPIGSGEGIVRTFMTPKDEAQAIWSAIFTAPEIDTLNALFARSGTTLESVIRVMFTGDTLGFTNSGKDTRTQVPRHTYRAGLIVGVQPMRAGVLLSGADGGTPQRFLWFPVLDRGMPDKRPSRPDPLVIKQPNFTAGDLTVPAAAVAAIDAHQLAMHRGKDVDPLAGHALLTRLKAAAALMVLDSRAELTEEDWRLAGTVMAVSDATREEVQREVRHRSRTVNRARALDAAEREEVGDDRRLQRTREAIIRWLAKVPGDGWLAANDLRKKIRFDLRGYISEALAQLTDEAQIAEERSNGGSLYRRVHPVHPVHPNMTSQNRGVRRGVRGAPHPPAEQEPPGETPEPPPPDGAPTEHTPGLTERVQQALANARNGHRPATPEQHAAYISGRCVDCGDRPPSAGRPRCDACHRIHTDVMAGYDR